MCEAAARWETVVVDTTAEHVQLEAGDIFLTRGNAFVSRAIRWFTRRVGEDRTKVNHVGIIVEPGTELDAIAVEALTTVREHSLGRYARKAKTSVAVFRPVGLSGPEIETIVAQARIHVGRKYGYRKVAAHLADWVLQGAYVFRRLTRDGNYPICSWIVAYAFHAVGKNFGVEPGAANPDDIWDFVDRHPEHYLQVRALRPFD